MQYAGIIKNDFISAPGVSTTFFTQGCPHRCSGCHNPETWDYKGGMEFTTETLNEITKALTANGIKRSLCIQGGEPLCPENQFLTRMVINHIKEKLPETKIYLWTGYLYKDLIRDESIHIQNILENIDCIIDGPFIEEERDITLFMKGSHNQNIIYLDKSKKI